MKRSEMLVKIENLMDDNGHRDPGCMADLILDTIEEYGMLPPFCEEIYLSVYRDGGTGHKWEQE